MGIAQHITTLSKLFNSDVISIINQAAKFLRRHASLSQGMYEVLSHSVSVRLHDDKGKRATYSKVQRVRFNQDNVIAYQDQAWGEGEIFADYQCSPGIPVDRYQDGHLWRILISLREVKSRGQIETFHIKRKIRNGFLKNREYLQTKIDHPTRRLSLSVTFPQHRQPRHVVLHEQNANRTTPLSSEHRLMLPDQRLKVTWSTKRPRRYEMYTLRWTW
jgi:hypothetical protein